LTIDQLAFVAVPVVALVALAPVILAFLIDGAAAAAICAIWIGLGVAGAIYFDSASLMLMFWFQACLMARPDEPGVWTGVIAELQKAGGRERQRLVREWEPEALRAARL
jgi:hypothetical protein